MRKGSEVAAGTRIRRHDLQHLTIPHAVAFKPGLQQRQRAPQSSRVHNSIRLCV
ncbi:Hypothetical protein (plasmid) [Pseudomonas putida]|nr:Hypothetical protein [Pseudomonas putida]